MSRLRRSLVACTAEGVVAEVVAACSAGAVLTGWALYLGCSPVLIGILGALPTLANLMQVPAVLYTGSHSHRRVAIVTVALSRQMLLPLLALPFLPLAPGAKQAVLLCVAAAGALLGVVGNNAWTAWMGELVRGPIRGRYFGRRSAICALGGTLAALAAGALLDRTARGSYARGAALAGLTAVASIAGFVTTWLMWRQHQPRRPAADPPRWRDALAALRDPRTRPLLVFTIAWNLAGGVVSMFDDVHMLRNLGIGFALVAGRDAMIASMRMVGSPLWGRAVDRAGARPVLLTCAFGLTVVPLLWLLSTPERWWPVAIEAIAGGILASGFSLSSFALPLAIAPREGRRFYLAVFSTAGGIAFAVASAAGGLIAQALPASFALGGRTVYGLQILFVLCAVGRLSAASLAMNIVEADSSPVPALFAMAHAKLKRLPLPRI